METCVFCKIINGEIPAEKIYEDDSVLAFLDSHPVNTGHSLVVPKNHIEEWHLMSEDLLTHVMGVAHKIGCQIKKSYNPPRVGLWIEGFEVSHAHIQISPLMDGHDLATKRTAADMRKAADPLDLRQAAAKLRQQD